MRHFGAVVAVLLALAVPGAAMPPGPAQIKVTATLVSAGRGEGGGVDVYALHNRPAYPGRIGTALVRCQSEAGFLACEETLLLKRGEIFGETVVSPAAAVRQFAIVGGTGYYANAGGEMTVQPLGGGQLIVVDLAGF